MRRLVLFTLMTLLLSILTCPAMADGPEGEKLVRDLWAAMKATDMPLLEKMTADGFQSVHCDGVDDRQGELDILKNLKPKDVVISDIKATRLGENVIITTYRVAAAETIKGERLADHAYPRLSIFVKTDKGWQWAAHANPRPLGPCVVK